MTARVAVLASGGGSNLQAIIDHFNARGARSPGRVVLVASDRQDAGALVRARTAGIDAVYLPAATRDIDLASLLRSRAIDLIALAGYLRLVPPDITKTYARRIVNIHPALLPAFGGPGMFGRRVHEAVLAAGAKESGATVHYVDEHYDRGDIIAQERVPVLPGDTADTLAARVLNVEHRLYPQVVETLCSTRK